MMRRGGALVLLLLVGCGAAHAELLDFTDIEIRAIARHGPWPPPEVRDPSNRVSGEAPAIALGQVLFFDRRLAASDAVACATCHIPARAWSDGRKQAIGLASLDRNTPSILNAALLRWYSWDGGADSLWSQALRAMLHPHEMGAEGAAIAALVAKDSELSCRYSAAFGVAPALRANDDVLVDTAKAIAAFVATRRTGRTAFDEFRDALVRGDRVAAGRYPVAAQRGLRLFAGRGHCSVCHFGAAFTNSEFHDIGVPFLIAPGRVDAGRYDGIKRVQTDPYNLLSRHSDDRSGAAATKTRHVELQQTAFGQFKTPSLRNVALTAPYMHDGRFETLREVMRHYSELDLERLHLHGESLLRPLQLGSADVDDLVAFLETLTAGDATAMPEAAPACAKGRSDKAGPREMFVSARQ